MAEVAPRFQARAVRRVVRALGLPRVRQTTPACHASAATVGLAPTLQVQWRFVNRAIDEVENGGVPAVLLICR